MSRLAHTSLVCLSFAFGVVLADRVEAQAAAEEVKAPAWTLRLSAGAGIGTRDFDLPRDGVIYTHGTGIFPALDLGFALDHRASSAFGLGLHARYQRSIGLTVIEQHAGGTTREQALRSQSIELAVAPELRFDSEGRWALATSFGYGISDLRPEVHLETPGYFLAGPFLRVELQVASGSVRLRLGPEVQWVAQVGRELVDEGVASSGIGAGAGASVELQLGPHWFVDVSYRELRIWLDSAQESSFQDIARFATAGLSGAL